MGWRCFHHTVCGGRGLEAELVRLKTEEKKNKMAAEQVGVGEPCLRAHRPEDAGLDLRLPALLAAPTSGRPAICT